MVRVGAGRGVWAGPGRVLDGCRGPAISGTGLVAAPVGDEARLGPQRGLEPEALGCGGRAAQERGTQVDRDQRIEVLVFDGQAPEQRPVMLRDLAEHPERLLVETIAYRLALLIEPHEDYLRLGREAAERQVTYRDLFRVHINPEMLKGVRQATQSNRVFGGDYFQTQIEAKLALRIAKQKRDRGGEKLALVTAGIITLTPNSPVCAPGSNA